MPSEQLNRCYYYIINLHMRPLDNSNFQPGSGIYSSKCNKYCKFWWCDYWRLWAGKINCCSSCLLTHLCSQWYFSKKATCCRWPWVNLWSCPSGCATSLFLPLCCSCLFNHSFLSRLVSLKLFKLISLNLFFNRDVEGQLEFVVICLIFLKLLSLHQSHPA